jgi:hypothetical protein
MTISWIYSVAYFLVVHFYWGARGVWERRGAWFDDTLFTRQMH